jgi:flavin-binding protein dodecin
MSDHVFKISEIVGTSHESTDDAITSAISRARETLRHIRWYEVVGQRGMVDEGGSVQFQVVLKVGFALDA